MYFKKKVLHCLFSMTIFLFLTSSIAYADFYVIAGSRGVGKEIRTLPYTISSPGFYYITKDLSCAAGNDGITMNADDVTLDLMGFSLVGPGIAGVGDKGISIGARTNIEIRNGTIKDFAGSGIFGNFNSIGSRIINIRIKNNNTWGIYIEGSGHLIKNCTATNNGVGFIIGGGSTLIGNISYNNGGHGFQVGGFSTLNSNTSSDNSLVGIDAGFGCTVSNNTCFNNNSDGIQAKEGSNVVGNTCRGNAGYGIALFGNNLVAQNNSTDNTLGNMNSCGTCTFDSNHAP